MRKAPMDDQLTISTPEQVAFHYEMAGIGTRFVASLLDHLIIGTALLLIECAMYAILVGSLFSANGGDSAGAYFVLALMFVISFLIFWGYFVLFETIWSGQTPGKRAGRLRVIRRDGQPVHAGEVMIRNLVRLVDILPGFYGIGLLVMFIDKDARRLGDMAAGTIVIKEGDNIRLQDVRISTPSTPAAEPAFNPDAYQRIVTTPQTTSYSGMITPNPSPYGNTGYAGDAPAAPRYDPLPGVSLRDVSPDDYLLIRELLARWSRGEMNHDRASALARTLAEGVAARMGHDFREWSSRGWDPVAFLQSVLIAKDARD